MPSSHLILCRPLLLPPIPPSIRVFSNESTLCMRWPKYWSFSFSIILTLSHLHLKFLCVFWWLRSSLLFNSDNILLSSCTSHYFFVLFCLLNFFLIFFKFYFIFKLYNIVLVLPNIEMNPPQVYMCSPSWTLLLPPSPYHPSGWSQCTSPKHPVSCIEPGLATRFIHDIIHVYWRLSWLLPSFGNYK